MWPIFRCKNDASTFSGECLVTRVKVTSFFVIYHVCVAQLGWGCIKEIYYHRVYQRCATKFKIIFHRSVEETCN